MPASPERVLNRQLGAADEEGLGAGDVLLARQDRAGRDRGVLRPETP
ncbi:hypothetical protein [Azotobacter chroococcum]|nr:hypothetical protein [Azotobacter chroococcum]